MKMETSSKELSFSTAEEAYTHYLTINRSIVDKMFMGHIQTGVTCHRCETTSYTFDPFIDLSL